MSLTYAPKPTFSTETESYLLHACLAENRETVKTNLAKWKKEQDFDLINSGSLRLIPILQKQLRYFEIEDPNLSVYKGIYRKCWLKNKLLFNEIVKVCSLLQSYGIPVIILKGIALSVLHYKDNGTRPMEDGDILIPFDKLEQALTVFRENGWFSRYQVNEENVYKYEKHVYHSVDYRNNDGYCIDIHWKPLCLASPDTIESELWANTQSIFINDVELQTLSHEFHFFHVITHGIRWNLVPSIRWIVDATTILQSVGDQFNWDEVITLTEKYHATVLIKEALHYLVTEFNVPIPVWVQEKLAATPVIWLNKEEYKAITHPNKFYSIIYYWFFVYYLKLRVVSAKWQSLPFLSGYIRYLRFILSADSNWHLISVLSKKAPNYILKSINLTNRNTDF